jgi:hypothetical protein
MFFPRVLQQTQGHRRANMVYLISSAATEQRGLINCYIVY